MNEFSNKKNFFFPKSFLRPSPINPKLLEEDSIFYKTFRLKTPAKNVRSGVNSSSSFHPSQKQYNYATYLIDTHQKKSF